MRKQLETIRLTDNQKQVLVTIIAAPTPQLAADNITIGRNIVAARDILIKLGLINFSPSKAEVTEKGKEVMRNENLIDDTDTLTDEGNKYLNTGNLPPPPQQTESLIKSINDLLSESN